MAQGYSIWQLSLFLNYVKDQWTIYWRCLLQFNSPRDFIQNAFTAFLFLHLLRLSLNFHNGIIISKSYLYFTVSIISYITKTMTKGKENLPHCRISFFLHLRTRKEYFRVLFPLFRRTLLRISSLNRAVKSSNSEERLVLFIYGGLACSNGGVWKRWRCELVYRVRCERTLSNRVIPEPVFSVDGW